MEADTDTSRAVRALIEQTYRALSTPGSDFTDLFGHEDIAAAGSGRGELFRGSEELGQVGGFIASRGLSWVPGRVTVWQQGVVAWAQILGHVEVTDDGTTEQVPYTTTGVFGLGPARWHWLYWGGAEPQEHPRV